MPRWFRGSPARKKVAVQGNIIERSHIVVDQRNITVTSGASSKPKFGLAELAAKPDLPENFGPSVLLAARYELIRYIGRERVLGELADWLAGDAVNAAKLVTGTGGQGKTRLALEVARH